MDSIGLQTRLARLGKASDLPSGMPTFELIEPSRAALASAAVPADHCSPSLPRRPSLKSREPVAVSDDPPVIDERLNATVAMELSEKPQIAPAGILHRDRSCENSVAFDYCFARYFATHRCTGSDAPSSTNCCLGIGSRRSTPKLPAPFSPALDDVNSESRSVSFGYEFPRVNPWRPNIVAMRRSSP